MAEQMADFLLTGAVVNALNMPSVERRGDAEALRPYMGLAGQIGGCIGQIIESAVKSVTIEYEGQAAQLDTEPLTALVLEGLLSPQMKTVNMVNAPSVAKERGIVVSEVKHERRGVLQTQIRLTVQTEVQARTIAGTIFNGDQPRIVEITEIPIDARLSPNMLFVSNHDRPGLIGGLDHPRRRRHQHRDLQPRPQPCRRRRHRPDRGGQGPRRAGAGADQGAPQRRPRQGAAVLMGGGDLLG